jgi:hypothetical protein
LKKFDFNKKQNYTISWKKRKRVQLIKFLIPKPLIKKIRLGLFYSEITAPIRLEKYSKPKILQNCVGLLRLVKNTIASNIDFKYLKKHCN